MQPKISVIVPVYNTEKYLRRCIDSIINQTYTNLEIILIDDGSTDGSGKIVDEYAKKDSRIIVVHQKNAGLSNVRNVGLKMFTGDYVIFVDSDDWIEPQMYSKMVEALQDDELDVVVCNYYKDYENKSVPMENAWIITDEIFNKEELLRYVFFRDYYRGFAAYTWNKLYHRTIVEGSQNDERYRLAEDVLWLSTIASKIKKCKYVKEPLYHYFQHENSSIHTKDLKMQSEMLLAYEDIINVLNNQNVSEKILIYVKRFSAYHAMNIAKMAYEQSDCKFLEFAQEIMRKYKNEYILTNKEYSERIDEFLQVEHLQCDCKEL